MSKLFGLMSVVLAASLAVGCNPCEDGCSGGPPPEPTAECVVPASEEPVTFLDAGETFQLEYGPQGGQHFYLSVALHGLEAGEVVFVELETEDGTFSTMPYLEASCPSDQALELKDIAFQLPSDDEVEGTLTVSIGACDTSDDGYCTWNESGQVIDFEARAKATQHVVVLAP